MLKRVSIRKILISLSALFTLFLIYFIPTTNDKELEVNYELEYVDLELEKATVFLLDSYSMLGRSEVLVSKNNRNIETRAKELLNVLIQGGSSEDKLPNGFRSILPSETKILSLKYDNGLIKVDFSGDILDIDQSMEEKMIEAIVYTLTSIDGVEQIIIYVDGDILSKLPKTKINLPSTLDRSFGINKEYDITSSKNINMVTIYYINKYNDNFYYVPVSKFTNDDRDKITIIIDSLSSSPIYNNNLMSFLNYNTKLLSATHDLDTMSLEFNSYIFSDYDNKKILEEVIYTISLSVEDNYDVDKLIFTVDNKEIYKTVFKSLE